jgi:hypothetical protein
MGSSVSPRTFLLVQVQSRRDAEIVRTKKYYLKLYMSDVGGFMSTPKRRCANVSGVSAPRPKYRRVSVDLWKEACQMAKNGYDEALPSLEEATQLFGYID